MQNCSHTETKQTPPYLSVPFRCINGWKQKSIPTACRLPGQALSHHIFLHDQHWLAYTSWTTMVRTSLLVIIGCNNQNEVKHIPQIIKSLSIKWGIKMMMHNIINSYRLAESPNCWSLKPIITQVDDNWAENCKCQVLRNGSVFIYLIKVIFLFNQRGDQTKLKENKYHTRSQSKTSAVIVFLEIIY